MRIKSTFLLSLFLFFVLWGLFSQETEKQTISSQIQQIDKHIEELQEMKRGFEARALRHENQAERLQFENRTYLETRRHLQLADENRAKATAVQEEIDRLKAQKQMLLEQEK